MFNLNEKVNIIDINHGLSKFSKNYQQKNFEIVGKNNENKLNKSLNNNIIFEEYIDHQNNFCNNPDKFYNQEYEKLLMLTKFSFRNISYQMYVYRKVDRWMSNKIIRTAKYEPFHMIHFLVILKYYAKKTI